MAILVTGGAGCIGSHCATTLIGRGAGVVVVDDLSKGHREVLKGGRLYVGNVADRAFLDDVFPREPIEVVVRFAAFSLVGKSMQVPEQYFRSNVTTGLTLIETILAHGVPYLVSSSIATTFSEPEYVPIDETHPQNPANPYDENKLIVEKMLKWCDLAHGLKFCAPHYSNVVGAWHDGSIGKGHRPESHLIPPILRVAQGKRGQLSLFGIDYPTKDGTYVRGHIHVEDLINARFLALDYLKRTNTSAAFNLGNGQGFSDREIIKAARRATGRPIPVREEDRRPDDPATLIAPSRKAMGVLGWQPKYTNVEDIVTSVWRWHPSHPDGYDG